VGLLQVDQFLVQQPHISAHSLTINLSSDRSLRVLSITLTKKHKKSLIISPFARQLNQLYMHCSSCSPGEITQFVHATDLAWQVTTHQPKELIWWLYLNSNHSVWAIKTQQCWNSAANIKCVTSAVLFAVSLAASNDSCVFSCRDKFWAVKGSWEGIQQIPKKGSNRKIIIDVSETVTNKPHEHGQRKPHLCTLCGMRGCASDLFTYRGGRLLSSFEHLPVEDCGKNQLELLFLYRKN